MNALLECIYLLHPLHILKVRDFLMWKKFLVLFQWRVVFLFFFLVCWTHIKRYFKLDRSTIYVRCNLVFFLYAAVLLMFTIQCAQYTFWVQMTIYTMVMAFNMGLNGFFVFLVFVFEFRFLWFCNMIGWVFVSDGDGIKWHIYDFVFFFWFFVLFTVIHN